MNQPPYSSPAGVCAGGAGAEEEGVGGDRQGGGQGDDPGHLHLLHRWPPVPLLARALTLLVPSAQRHL